MEAAVTGRKLELVLLRELSAGTFARLYVAEVRGVGGIDRLVALKVVREQWSESEEVINRTRDEARLLARLRHKNILRVEEMTEIDGHPAILMEFVDGLDLKQIVEALAKQNKRIEARVILQIGYEAASALDAAFNRIPLGVDRPLSVVHRDIKPSNLMLTTEGELKVLDFGTARANEAFRASKTTSLRLGSLKYMSPERREGDRGEPPADIYALGLTLLELFKGGWLPTLSMDAEPHDLEVIEAVNDLPSVGMPNAEWDIALRRFLVRMLASNPIFRPNAEEVVRTLRAFAEHASGPMLDTYGPDMIAPLTRQIRGSIAADHTSRRVEITVGAPSRSNDPVRPPENLIEPDPTGVPKAAFEQRRPPRPSVPPAMVAPEMVAEETKPHTSLLLGMGGVALVLLGLGLIIVLAGGGYLLYNRSPSSAPVPSPAPTPPQVTEVAPADPGVSLSVTADGAALQWIRLETPEGIQVSKASGPLQGQLPAGDYHLSIKYVGRPILSADFKLPAEGLSLACTLDKEGAASCTAGKLTLKLKG